MPHTIHLRALYAPALLPRILLAFSRRRLAIQALHFEQAEPSVQAAIRIQLECEPRMARELAAMLERIVELEAVWVEANEALPRLAVA